MTLFTSDTTGLNTGGVNISNSYLNLAANFTDDDLVNQDSVEINWPSSNNRFNHCTVRFPNESENFKEDSASWPPKVSGSIYRGIGGKLYKPQSGWDEVDPNSGGARYSARLLNNLGVWSGPDTDGADGQAPEMNWTFIASASDSCTLEFAADDWASILIRDITNLPSSSETLVSLSVSWPAYTTTTLNLVINRKYIISVNSSDSGGLQGVAGRLYGTNSGIEYWSTKAIAYDDMELQNQSNAIYQTFLEEDNFVELEEDVSLEGITDYYHALAKAEEKVRTSRTALTISFKYIIKDKFIEPGDYIKLDSARLSLQNLYLRVDDVTLEDNGICSVNATRFDWTQLAWNVKDDQLIKPENLYNFEIDSPTNVILNSADTTLEGTIGKLIWNGVFSEVTGYIVYIAEVVNNQIGEYQEIGRTNNTYFSVPPFNYTTVAFGVRSYTTLGKKSPIVTTGIIQVTQNYKRDLTISANHLMFIQEAYSTNFTTPSIILTAVARGFSNPTYAWFLDNTAIPGISTKTLQIEPFLGAPRYYKVQVSEFKPGSNVAIESLEYTILVQSRKESIRATINASPSLPPPPPLNFNVKPLYNSVKLSWTIPTYNAGEVPHGYTEIKAVILENSFENWDTILTGMLQATASLEPGNTIFKKLLPGDPSRILGDLNNDGVFSGTDIDSLNQFLAGTASDSIESYINHIFRPELQTDITGTYSAYFNYNTTEALAALDAAAFKIADVSGDVNNFIFAGDPGTDYLFILTEVNAEGVRSTTSVKLGATTSPNTTKLIETLSNKINATELNTTLNTRIDLIDAPTTGLVTKVTNLESTTSSLNTSITTITSRTEYGEGFTPKLSFNFDTNTESFSASNAAIGWNALFGSGTLGVFNSNQYSYNVVISRTFTTSQRFFGGYHPIVRIKLKRTLGDSIVGWIGDLRYSTTNHSFSSSYRKVNSSLPSGVTLLANNATDWFVVEWDMSTLTNGGNDWLNNTITGIQLYFHYSIYSEWYIDWIAIGTKTINSAQALYNQEVITRTNADSALSQQIINISADLNGLTAAVQQKMTARAEDGTLLSAYSLVIDNSGNLSGFGLESVVDTQTGASQSVFGVNADKFYISSPGVTSVKPFIVTDNIVYIDTARIKDGSITNAKIGNLAADKITSGFINADRIEAESITAAKINSNGLSIRDAAGNILFNAGAAKPLDSTLVNGLGALATKHSLDYFELTTVFDTFFTNLNKWEGIGDNSNLISDSSVSGGTFLRVTGYKEILSKDYIPVDTNRIYYSKCRARRASGTTGTFYAGFACYDKDKNYIAPNPPGSTYNYSAFSAENLTSNWTTKGNYIDQPMAPDAGALHFRPGTAFVKLMMLCNYQGSNNDVTDIDFLEFYDVTESYYKLDNNARNLLSGPGGFATGDLNWDANGTRTSGTGIGFTTKGIVAYNAEGNPTFTLDGINGNASFKGNITGASGTFSGNLSGADITGAIGTFSGTLSADSITANSIKTRKLVSNAVSSVLALSELNPNPFPITSSAYTTVFELTLSDSTDPEEGSYYDAIISISASWLASTYGRYASVRLLKNNSVVLFNELLGIDQANAQMLGSVDNAPGGAGNYKLQFATRDALQSGWAGFNTSFNIELASMIITGLKR